MHKTRWIEICMYMHVRAIVDMQIKEHVFEYQISFRQLYTGPYNRMSGRGIPSPAL